MQGSDRYYTIPRTVRELQQNQGDFTGLQDYTIPRTVRELQRLAAKLTVWHYYTIPRTVRELQLDSCARELEANYTIPRTVRELQPECGHESANGIIPYQELPGVYQRGETPATYPFFQNKMRALFSAFSLFFACT